MRKLENFLRESLVKREIRAMDHILVYPIMSDLFKEVILKIAHEVYS